MRRSSLFVFALGLFFSLSVYAARGGGYDRVFAFGDSLSDGGTYSLVAGPQGGGKFTTNPGKIWVELVADYFGLALTPNRYEGFGTPLQLLGGGNYAQGGALLSRSMPVGTGPSASARSVREQFSYFVAEHASFAARDLVLLQAGANDNLLNSRLVAAGKMTAADAVLGADLTAKDLAALALEMVKFGAVQIVVLNLPALDITPLGLAQPAGAQGLLAKLTDTFNTRLATQLQGQPAITLVDLHTFDTNFNVNYKLLGFTDITSVAWNGGSSLFCSPKTLAAPHADQTYKFADNVHPTTGYSKYASEFILRAITKQQMRTPRVRLPQPAPYYY